MSFKQKIFIILSWSLKCGGDVLFLENTHCIWVSNQMLHYWNWDNSPLNWYGDNQTGEWTPVIVVKNLVGQLNLSQYTSQLLSSLCGDLNGIAFWHILKKLNFLFPFHSYDITVNVIRYVQSCVRAQYSHNLEYVRNLWFRFNQLF